MQTAKSKASGHFVLEGKFINKLFYDYSTQDGKEEPLSTGDNTKINSAPKETTISRTDCVRKNTGMYKIVVENKHGSDFAEIEVVVLGMV